jgi:hypothetical protein
MAVRQFSILFFLFLVTQLSALAVNDSVRTINKKRLRTSITVAGMGYGATLVGLNYLWYKDTERQSFRFFNDNAQWKQMDKMGHFYSTFYLSYGASKGLQWSDVSKRKSDLWGSAVGFLFMLPIEIMDGFSSDYGASSGDLLANALGAGFYLGQSRLWNELRIQPKFSFSRTPYPALRDDDILGNSLLSEIVKDYNGHTFWLSFDMDKFIRFPKWINIAIGYGAQGMVHARDAQNTAEGFEAYRQYYVGIDFDLSGLKTNSKAFNTLLFVVGMIKLPAPAIELSKHGSTFRFFQF